MSPEEKEARRIQRRSENRKKLMDKIFKKILPAIALLGISSAAIITYFEYIESNISLYRKLPSGKIFSFHNDYVLNEVVGKGIKAVDFSNFKNLSGEELNKYKRFILTGPLLPGDSWKKYNKFIVKISSTPAPARKILYKILPLIKDLSKD
jgi:hypothetical protein